VELLAPAEMMLGAEGGWVAPALTVTVAIALTAPALFEAVSLYVVVRRGETTLDDALVTSLAPLSITSAEAPETFQVRVAVCPALMEDGVALNAEITGSMIAEGGPVFCQETWADPVLIRR
jgi:hypothetical protein